MRDIVVLLTIACAIPYCLTRPFFGLMVFSWLAYMRPQDLCWGIARGMHFSQVVAMLMFGGFFLYETRPFSRKFPGKLWIYLLVLWISLSVFRHYDYPHLQLPKYLDFLKVVVVALFTVGLVDSKKRLDLLTWTILLSLGFYGVKCGLFGLLTGGRILQGPGGMLKDNNDFCLAMNMILPLAFYTSFMTTSAKVRRALWGITFLTIIAIIVTTSRGGFLTLAGVLGLFVLKSRNRMIGIAAGMTAVILFIIFMPADVRERLATLKEPTQEGSAAGRLHAWRVAWEMAKAEPVFGVGFNTFPKHFRKYDPTPEELWETGKGVASVRVTHNSYLQLLSECGWPTLLFFLAMLGSTLLLMRKLRRMVRARAGPRWAVHYSNMIEVSILAYCAGSMFLNRSHFDLLYHMVALGACVYLIAVQEMREGPVSDEEIPGARTESFELSHRDPFLAGAR